MKQLLILSGKGGTGKTTIAGAFIRMAGVRACADCDVDAPNLHLILSLSAEPERSNYYGMPRAVIDPEKCTGCGLCIEACRFGAISYAGGDGSVCRADPFACEGCGVCRLVCPADAVAMEPAVAGDLIRYAGADAVFSTARLRMGSGNSGMLVTEVKKRMKEAVPEGTGLAIIDGSPGIGCPVIASLSGADMVLIVAEPSVSGISDMERILQTAAIFHMKTAVCVNKYDTSPANTRKIERICKERGLPFTGRIPYDPEAVKAVNRGLTLADVDCPAGRAAAEVYRNTMEILFR